MKRHQKNNVTIPLALRLKAWWEGYDLVEIKERLSKLGAGNIGKTRSESQRYHVADTETLDPWDERTVDIAQFIWGRGFCGPGGPDYIVSLSKLLALGPEMSMLQIGAGLGGPARVLAEKFGVWISGYEASSQLIKHGQRLCDAAGMSKKVELIKYEPERSEGFARKFERAFAKEALYTIENKWNIVRQVERNLKPGGLFLLTDYVLGSSVAAETDSFKEWKVGERLNPFPVLAEDLEEIIKANGLEIRVSEDISQDYISMIDRAWAGAGEVAAMLVEKENGAGMIQVLMLEAEYWTRLRRLLKTGDLKLWRLMANKGIQDTEGC